TPAVPALVLAKVDAGVPVGPSSRLSYTLTVENVGNAPATGVTISDPVPVNTSFVSADSGGTNQSGTGTWPGFSIPAGGSVSVHATVAIANALKNKVTAIVNDGVNATSAEGPFTTGSPRVTPIAPPFAVAVLPATQTDGARVGNSVTYDVSLKNLGSNTDSYAVSTSGGTFPARVLDPTCTTTLTTTPPVAPAATA